MNTGTNGEEGKLRFPMGQVGATPGALSELKDRGLKPSRFLARHLRGDWGDVPPEDARENEIALELGNRLVSSYKLDDSCTIWIITKWDRSVTTILLPYEY